MEPVVFAPHLVERFWSRVIRTETCWLWTGSLNRGGYGQINLTGRATQAHRIAWQLTYGPIPAGLHVCHTCDATYPVGDITYRRCVNPSHLFLGTAAENTADARRKGRLAKGKRSGPQLHRERMPRGAGHYLHREPQRIQGEKNPSSLLTDDQVMAIRWQFVQGASKAALGRQYGVARSTIFGIVTRRSWKHLP